ncbi:MAG: hypothetical protein FJW23_00670 [Acidimicrobiia bacterium]|nr:hypothetical protein [Acidimicrobiia bacterium]
MEREQPTIRHSVHVACAAAEVFTLVADSANDPRWREGVYAVEVSGPLAVGRHCRESRTTLRVFHSMTPFTVTALEPPRRVVLETPGHHPWWQRQVREVRPISAQRSLLVVEQTFDVWHVLAPLVPWVRASRLKDDLRRVRRLLEGRARRGRQGGKAD